MRHLGLCADRGLRPITQYEVARKLSVQTARQAGRAAWPRPVCALPERGQGPDGNRNELTCLVAQNSMRNRVEPIARGHGKAREGLFVATLCSSHKIGIHASPLGPGVRSGRPIHTVWACLSTAGLIFDAHARAGMKRPAAGTIPAAGHEITNDARSGGQKPEQLLGHSSVGMNAGGTRIWVACSNE